MKPFSPRGLKTMFREVLALVLLRWNGNLFSLPKVWVGNSHFCLWHDAFGMKECLHLYTAVDWNQTQHSGQTNDPDGAKKESLDHKRSDGRRKRKRSGSGAQQSKYCKLALSKLPLSVSSEMRQSWTAWCWKKCGQHTRCYHLSAPSFTGAVTSFRIFFFYFKKIGW